MAVKVCKNCGESNSENATLCVACSNSLKDSQVVGTLDADKQFERILTSTPSTCWHCQEKVKYDALKCKYCGSILKRPSKTSMRYYGPQHASGSSMNGCAIILLFLATLLVPLVGLIVGGIFTFNDDPDKRAVGIGLLALGLAIVFVGIFLWAF